MLPCMLLQRAREESLREENEREADRVRHPALVPAMHKIHSGLSPQSDESRAIISDDAQMQNGLDDAETTQSSPLGLGTKTQVA